MIFLEGLVCRLNNKIKKKNKKTFENLEFLVLLIEVVVLGFNCFYCSFYKILLTAVCAERMTSLTPTPSYEAPQRFNGSLWSLM